MFIPTSAGSSAWVRAHRRDLGDDQEVLRKRLQRDLSDTGARGRIFRVYPPCDSGERVEILLVGDNGAPYTVYLPADATSAAERVVEAGW